MGWRMVSACVLRQRLAAGVACKRGECGSTLLPQSWSVIAGAGDTAKARRAMDSAEARTGARTGKLVLLFTPPFDHSKPNPGYIMGYPPGLRENGGQYTHGSLWMALAWPGCTKVRKAVRMLQLMNPMEHSRTHSRMRRATGANLMWSRRDVYNAPAASGNAGGPGTPGRRHGCTGSGRRKCWGSGCVAISLRLSRCCRTTGRGLN